mmetsp:Transcript_12526/g.27954  ORF Transcript_12526/g.27954 Transcript_12526/m.27954 type:complete len:281 (-) Transcript_12526:105-947(-)
MSAVPFNPTVPSLPHFCRRYFSTASSSHVPMCLDSGRTFSSAEICFGFTPEVPDTNCTSMSSSLKKPSESSSSSPLNNLRKNPSCPNFMTSGRNSTSFGWPMNTCANSGTKSSAKELYCQVHTTATPPGTRTRRISFTTVAGEGGNMMPKHIDMALKDPSAKALRSCASATEGATFSTFCFTAACVACTSPGSLLGVSNFAANCSIMASLKSVAITSAVCPVDWQYSARHFARANVEAPVPAAASMTRIGFLTFASFLKASSSMRAAAQANCAVNVSKGR